jgi:hypothetical protein
VIVEAKVPDHALPWCGKGSGFDWDSSEWIPEPGLKVLPYGGVARFSTPKAIIAVTDMDCDIDGPGGSKLTDEYWQPGTSLRTAAGLSVDSREFPGVVIDVALIKLGIAVGDFGFIVWHGAVRGFQVYDTGPTALIGEASVYLLRAIGAVLPNQTDHYAANNANAAKDFVTIFFPGSGPRHAISPKLIGMSAKRCLPAGAALLDAQID